jgi:hypothetical protein
MYTSPSCPKQGKLSGLLILTQPVTAQDFLRDDGRLCPNESGHMIGKGTKMNMEIPILGVAVLLLAALAYGKELLVSLGTLFHTTGQNEKDVHSSDRNDDAAGERDLHLQDL